MILTRIFHKRSVVDKRRLRLPFCEICGLTIPDNRRTASSALYRYAFVNQYMVGPDRPAITNDSRLCLGQFYFSGLPAKRSI